MHEDNRKSVPKVPFLVVTPKNTLMYETVDITVSNLKSGETVSIVAVIINDEDDGAFYACGEFQADSAGCLDVNRSYCFRGTYVGIESMGLFWSAKPAPGQRKGLRLIKRVLRTPLTWNLLVVEGGLPEMDATTDSFIVSLVNRLRAAPTHNGSSESYDDVDSCVNFPCNLQNKDQRVLQKDENIDSNSTKNTQFRKVVNVSNIKILAQAMSIRYFYYTSDIDEIPVRDGRVRGIIFLPKHLNKNETNKSNAKLENNNENIHFDAENKSKNSKGVGIIEIYGGGNFKNHRAALLAQKGYIVLSLAYCNYDDLPKEMITDVDYLVETANFMLSERCPGKVDVQRGLGIIGFCKGANLALEAAIYHNSIKAVVAINSPCFNDLGQFRRPGSDKNVAHDWTIESPFLGRTNEGVICEGLFDWFAQKTETEKKEIGIAVEKIESAEILFIYGAGDAAIGLRPLRYMVDRLNAAGKKNYRCLVYPEAGHLLDPPIFPLCYSSYWPLFKEVFVWGGDSKFHHFAQLDSWNQILKFLSCHFGEVSLSR